MLALLELNVQSCFGREFEHIYFHNSLECLDRFSFCFDKESILNPEDVTQMTALFQELFYLHCIIMVTWHVWTCTVCTQGLCQESLILVSLEPCSFRFLNCYIAQIQLNSLLSKTTGIPRVLSEAELFSASAGLTSWPMLQSPRISDRHHHTTSSISFLSVACQNNSFPAHCALAYAPSWKRPLGRRAMACPLHSYTYGTLPS